MSRLSKVVAVWVALLAVGSGATTLAELRDGTQAMACCAKTDYSCARMQAPDDCCRNMGHAAAHQVPATSENHPSLALPIAITINVTALAGPSTTDAPPITSAFTRPHDPPHLHPFALLI